jgi:hypothetical protein
MAVIEYPTQGAYPLDSVEKLPNVNIAFPGEHWSDGKASGDIVPGQCIVPVIGADGNFHEVAGSAASGMASQAAIALRTVDHPDTNTGPSALGPNEIRNQVIPDGEYVHRYLSGGFHLTLIVADTYKPGDLIGWDADGVVQTGKTALGPGAWAKNAAADIQSLFEVQEFRTIGAANRGILTVRSLRGQF